MNVLLQRTYFEEGTNSALFYNGQFLGFAIELPWLKTKEMCLVFLKANTN